MKKTTLLFILTGVVWGCNVCLCLTAISLFAFAQAWPLMRPVDTSPTIPAPVQPTATRIIINAFTFTPAAEVNTPPALTPSTEPSATAGLDLPTATPSFTPRPTNTPEPTLTIGRYQTDTPKPDE